MSFLLILRNIIPYLTFLKNTDEISAIRKSNGDYLIFHKDLNKLIMVKQKDIEKMPESIQKIFQRIGSDNNVE